MADNETLSDSFIYVSCTFNALISLLAIFGNSLVLVSFFKSSKLRRSHTNHLIASLAVADLITACVALPLRSYMIATNFSAHTNNQPMNKIYIVFDIFSNVASIIHLAFISLERYFALVWPVTHHVASSTTYGFVIVLAWILSIFASCMSLVFVSYKHYRAFNVVFLFGIPLTVIVFSYLSILRSTVKRSHSRVRGVLEREMKVAMTVFILVALFVITWSPFFILMLVSLYCEACKISRILTSWLKILHYSNSFCNPIVYAARMPDFRRAFGTLLPKKLFQLLTCRMGEVRKDSPPNSRGRAGSALSTQTTAVDGGRKESRARMTNVKTVNHELMPVQNSNETPSIGGSLVDGSPCPLLNCQLTDV